MKGKMLILSMKFEQSKSNIHIISRGLIVQGGDIILCKAKGAGWFFLPGGHIEEGESARSALLRELEEETGIDNFQIVSLIGICENIFSLDKETSQHEINIIFEVNIPQILKIESKESNIEFVNIKRGGLKNSNILPSSLKDGVLEWLENKKPFFKEI